MKKVIFEKRTFRVFDLKSGRISEEVILYPCRYRGVNGDDGPLAIQIMLVEQGTVTEPWSTLTVNLDCYTGRDTQTDTRAYVDTNNNGCWDCLRFLEENGLAKPVGILAQSGYCTYPLYEFDLDRLYAED